MHVFVQICKRARRILGQCLVVRVNVMTVSKGIVSRLSGYSQVV